MSPQGLESGVKGARLQGVWAALKLYIGLPRAQMGCPVRATTRAARDVQWKSPEA